MREERRDGEREGGKDREREGEMKGGRDGEKEGGREGGTKPVTGIELTEQVLKKQSTQ